MKTILITVCFACYLLIAQCQIIPYPELIIEPLPVVQIRPSNIPSTANVKCSDSSCTFHWIFALDKSGSMIGNKYTSLKSLMTSITDYLEYVTRQRITVYTFDSRASMPPQKYTEYSNPATWDSSVLDPAGGGTNFGQPLIRAIQFILLHRSIHTCYVMLTDGISSYPGIEI